MQNVGFLMTRLIFDYNCSPFDPEEDNLGPEMIPDLAERQEKADELEEQFMQTTVASEDEEYNREQDIYSQEEVNMRHVTRQPVIGILTRSNTKRTV